MCHMLLASLSFLADMARLTFRNDISRSIPSLSNLCVWGRGGTRVWRWKKEQEGWGGSVKVG